MCGIFGIVAKKPRRFDYTTFCTLGIHNDLRGGDSCGVYIDGQVEYGVDKKKFFEDFLTDSNLVQNTKEAMIAFGHDRKASVGLINEKTAQPVVLYNEDGKVDFVVMHNGTIYNYEDLAKKYIPEVDIKGMTDSQVMTRIFYYKGYDVLKEYNGGAVFAIADYRGNEPEVFFWQGASPLSVNGKVEDERPLYIAINKDHIVFSSIYTFLPVLCRNAEIVQLTPNWLYTYKNNDIVSVEEYSRVGQCQYRKYTYSTGSSTTSYNSSTKTTTYSSGQTASTYSNTSIYGSTKDGRCFKDGKALHGNIKSTCYGFTNTCGQMYDLWFWQGIMLNNKDCFDYLCKISQEFGANPEEMYDIYPELILFLSPYPYLRTVDGTVEVVNSPISSEVYTGTFQFPFTSTEYKLENGKLVSAKTTTMFDGLNAYIKHRDDKLPMSELISNFGDYETC